MKYSFLDFLTLVGSLGMFLYGMKTMSEGLQKLAGDKLRNILSVMTTNRFTGVLTGFLITALIQSSSATTVMVVSFVNAGLLSLSQSIGVIMGANVGTTVTAWIISLFGFRMDISLFALPLIGVSIPLMFARRSRYKSWGEFIMGFALLFLGLEYLKSSVPDLQSNPQALAFIRNYTSTGYASLLLFLCIGTLLTIVVQSSSATVAITLVMCARGWIPFEIALAMILGENIGTTITANLAALPANTGARRAAVAHLLFNVLGVCWCMALFYPFANMISWIVSQGPGDPHELERFLNTLDPQTISLISSGDELTDSHMIALRERMQTLQVSVSYGMSLFHTMFNVTNVCIMIWFTRFYVRICSALIKSPPQPEEEFQLKYISSNLLSTSELSIMQAKKETAVFSKRTCRMFDMVKSIVHERDDEKFLQIYNRIQKYEQISDRMEVEIASYLARVLEGHLSARGKNNVRIMLRVVSEIESIGDSCCNMARTVHRRNEAKAVFTEEQNHCIEHMFTRVDGALAYMDELLCKPDVTHDDLMHSYNLEAEINSYRNLLKNRHIESLNSTDYKYSDAVYYMDIISECEKAGDYILNVVQAEAEAEKEF
ncbi:MAG: Na/Pi cotransporter family protein [Tannerella sp.]|nr:Na/Pi cotransporter family protein [Tannerella sp.]